MSPMLPPRACPRCGGSQLVRILWDYYSLTEDESRAVAGGQAILGLNDRYSRKVRSIAIPEARVHRLEKSRLPTWACLDCNPRWNDLHRLAVQELELEHAKWTAFDAGDFDNAVAILKDQERLELEHSREVWALLRVLASEAIIGD